MNVSPAVKAPVITYTYTVYAKKYPENISLFHNPEARGIKMTAATR
jgi:hypothetical protein